MGLFLVVLDWILLVLTFIGEVFYFLQIVKDGEKESVLMDMMKFLLLNDVISMPISFIHDVPSYFMDVSLSDRVFIIKELGILSHCFPFFYSLLMLPVFALLNLIAIVAVYIFVTIKKRRISQVAIVICYVSAIIWSVPLITDYCGFEYNSTTHYWHYDFDKPFTAIYQRANWTLQIGVLVIVTICMSVVLIYLALKGKTLNNQTNVRDISRNSNSQTRFAHTSNVTTHQTVHSAQTSTTTNSRSVMDQAFAFIILCLCFICGTISFNFFYWLVSLRFREQPFSDAFGCMIFTIISSYASRAKWVIYCILMRRKATISQLFQRRR